MRSLKESLQAQVDISLVIMIGVCFAALMVIAFIIFKLRDQLMPAGVGGWAGHATNAENASYNTTYQSINNVTIGFDAAVNLILVAITVFILAIAIGALLMLRGR